MCLRKATQSVSRTSLLHQTYRQSFKFATPRAIALIPTSLHRSLSYLPSLQKPTGILGMSRESKDIDSRQVGPAQKTDEQSINVENSIISKLTELLEPTSLEVINESHLHSHHSAMRAIGGGSGETHFAVQVVSPAFEGLSRIARHRKIYAALNHEFSERGLHALSLKTFTPEEQMLHQQ